MLSEWKANWIWLKGERTQDYVYAHARRAVDIDGNAAGAGARLALIDRTCREQATAISEETEYIELGGRPDFQEEFMMAMMFPDA